ncbi:MAG: alpha/beta fold hydrolase, partial [bacterium]
MNGIESRDVTVPATDDYQLAGTIYRPEATSKGAIVITSAMAVARSFYQPFARWFADRGFSVLTFDYRGIGNSAPEDLRGFQGTVADWALKDIQGAINWMKEFTPDGPLYVIAHSIGGQIMGLLGDNVEIDGLVTVSAQSGYC